MEAGKARKRPVVVDYMELTDDNGAEVAEWCGGEWWPGSSVVLVPTIEGQLRARPTDRVVRGTQGEYYPVRADVFAAVYEIEQEAGPC